MIIYCYGKCYQNAVSVCLKEHKTHRFMNPKIYIRTTLQTVHTKTYSACVSWSIPIHHYSTYIIQMCIFFSQHKLFFSKTVEGHSHCRLWDGTDPSVWGGHGYTACRGQCSCTLDLHTGHCPIHWPGEKRCIEYSLCVLQLMYGSVHMCTWVQ